MAAEQLRARTRIGRAFGVAGVALAVAVSPVGVVGPAWAFPDIDIPDIPFIDPADVSPFDGLSSIAAALHLDGFQLASSAAEGGDSLPAAAPLPEISVPVTTVIGTEPVISVSVGGTTSDYLVDSGATGMVVPFTEFGWNGIGLPTGFNFGAFGGLQYFYLTVPTTLDIDGHTFDNVPVDVVLFAWPTSFDQISTFLSSPLNPFNGFLGGAADGIFGVGPDALGPDSQSLVENLGYDGVLLNQSAGTLQFGSADQLTGSAADGWTTLSGTAANGSPFTGDLYVGYTLPDGQTVDPVHAPNALVDSGGVLGSIPQDLLPAGVDKLDPGTTISVYNGPDATTPLYTYTIPQGTEVNGYTYGSGVDLSPTIGAAGSYFNTGNPAFWNSQVYFGLDDNGNPVTIFGPLPSP